MTDRQKQKESARLYREMVAAVRAWVRLSCPDDFADRLTISREAGDRITELAHFHSGTDSRWTRGDMMACHRI